MASTSYVKYAVSRFEWNRGIPSAAKQPKRDQTSHENLQKLRNENSFFHLSYVEVGSVPELLRTVIWRPHKNVVQFTVGGLSVFDELYVWPTRRVETRHWKGSQNNNTLQTPTQWQPPTNTASPIKQRLLAFIMALSAVPWELFNLGFVSGHSPGRETNQRSNHFDPYCSCW